MKIVFLGLGACYTPGMSYQDNCFNDVLLSQGHDVCYLSNPEMYVDGELVTCRPGTECFPDGLKLIRVRYVRILTSFVTKKLRAFPGVYQILLDNAPDCIYCHGFDFLPVRDVARYKRAHPEVRVYADTHTNYANSARNCLSRRLLHELYYRSLYKTLESSLEKLFYVGDEERQFALDIYRVKESLLSYLPLGGFCPTDEEYQSMRASAREEFSLRADEILLVHSGKMDPQKKTEQLLRAFSACKDFPGKLALIGSIPEEMRVTLLPLIEADPRIIYLGWKSADELRRYLCACDLYCQPGSVSATMQNAICCRCPVLAYPHESYLRHYDAGNLTWVRDEEEILSFLRKVGAAPEILARMSQLSVAYAAVHLDYRTLVRAFTFD